jgi:hypothetical protein
MNSANCNIISAALISHVLVFFSMNRTAATIRLQPATFRTCSDVVLVNFVTASLHWTSVSFFADQSALARIQSYGA